MTEVVIGISPTLHDRNGGSYKSMNEVGRGKSCRGEGYLLLLFLFAQKQSKADGQELGRHLAFGINAQREKISSEMLLGVVDHVNSFG